MCFYVKKKKIKNEKNREVFVWITGSKKEATKNRNDQNRKETEDF